MVDASFTTDPIFVTRSKLPVDGEFDFALSIERGGKKLVVAEVFGRLSEWVIVSAEANAKLFAAAPDLLAALKAVAPEGWLDDDTMDHMPGIKQARAAIAKAEGRTS